MHLASIAILALPDDWRAVWDRGIF